MASGLCVLADVVTYHDKCHHNTARQIFSSFKSAQVMTSCPPDYCLFALIHWSTFAWAASETKNWEFLQPETSFTVISVKHHLTWHHLVILIEAWKCLLKKRPSILDETKVPSLFRCGRMSLPPYVVYVRKHNVCVIDFKNCCVYFVQYVIGRGQK